MRNIPAARWLLLLVAVGSVPSVRAELSALVALEPTQRKDGLMISRPGLESGLRTLLAQPVSVATTEDLTDTMRATRSGAHDVFVAPPQVVASAMSHGYELLGSTEPEEEYVLVARPNLAAPADARSGRLYLPQQDSIYTYMARGMLTAHGMSFKDMAQVRFERFPQAGLTAVSVGLAELTVVRKREWDAWIADNPGKARVVARSGPVPGGLSVAVRKELGAEPRARLARWFTSQAASVGLKNVSTYSDSAQYQRVAQLGTFTPNALPGARVVGAAEVQSLVAQGAVVADTRTDKEFRAKRMPGARFVPYVEKSLKDVAYDPKLDEFPGLAQLDKSLPTIFHCNGAECWKSYKASKAALAAGFTKVYWFRGGLPEWEKAGLPIDRSEPKLQVAQK